MDHLVVLGLGPVGRLEQGPSVVEQVGHQLAARRRVDLGRGSGRGHGGRVLRAELAEDVQDALKPERAGLDPRAVLAQDPSLLDRVVGRKQVADRLERDLEVAHPDDRPRRHELVAPIRAAVGERVDPSRTEQVRLVVMAQRAPRSIQPAARTARWSAGRPSSHRGPSAYPRVKGYASTPHTPVPGDGSLQSMQRSGIALRRMQALSPAGRVRSPVRTTSHDRCADRNERTSRVEVVAASANEPTRNHPRATSPRPWLRLTHARSGQRLRPGPARGRLRGG